jgi:hypothetical protein
MSRRSARPLNRKPSVDALEYRTLLSGLGSASGPYAPTPFVRPLAPPPVAVAKMALMALSPPVSAGMGLMSLSRPIDTKALVVVNPSDAPSTASPDAPLTPPSIPSGPRAFIAKPFDAKPFDTQPFDTQRFDTQLLDAPPFDTAPFDAHPTSVSVTMLSPSSGPFTVTISSRVIYEMAGQWLHENHGPKDWPLGDNPQGPPPPIEAQLFGARPLDARPTSVSVTMVSPSAGPYTITMSPHSASELTGQWVRETKGSKDWPPGDNFQVQTSPPTLLAAHEFHHDGEGGPIAPPSGTGNGPDAPASANANATGTATAATDACPAQGSTGTTVTVAQALPGAPANANASLSGGDGQISTQSAAVSPAEAARAAQTVDARANIATQAGLTAATGDPSALAEADLPPARGSDLLADFQPGEAGVLGDAVDRFLDQLQELGAGFTGPEDALGLALASWPSAAVAALVGLELGRRWLKREEGEGNGDDNGTDRPSGPRGHLSGWPGSWSWSAGTRLT